MSRKELQMNDNSEMIKELKRGDMMKKTKIIAHRGASALAHRENTLEAFEIAIDYHADMVEFDIRKTKDNQLIVFHDATIQGKTIHELTYAQMNELAKTEDYRVPLLVEVLELCQGKIELDVELKEAGYEEKVIEELCQRYDYDKFSIKSFNPAVPKRVKELDSNILTGLLVGQKHKNPSKFVKQFFPEEKMRKCKADFISPYYKIAMAPGFLSRMRKNNWPVHVWTVNEKKTIDSFILKEVDGIITDHIDYILKK